MTIKKHLLTLFAFSLLFGLTSLPAFAANSIEVVQPEDMATSIADVIADPSKWLFYNDENDTIDNTLGSFVTGPATPPLGTESVQLSVTGSQRKNLTTYRFSGTPLASITTLAFSTYNPSAGNGGSVNRSGYLHFNVDFDGSDTWQRRLVFVPSLNGAVVQDTWQEWDALQGGSAKWLYSGTTWPGTAQSGSTPKTWSQILTDYPVARIRVTDSFLGIRVGEPYADGYTENLDGFKFGTGTDMTTFDFDKTPNGKAEGILHLLGTVHKIKFHVFESDVASNDKNEHGYEGNNRVEYWNYDYSGGLLHYKTFALCTNVDKPTKSVRFMFQIPSGWSGLSGRYVVSYVQDNLTKDGAKTYGHKDTTDLATAQTWCETGLGFSPTMYVVKKGEVAIK